MGYALCVTNLSLTDVQRPINCIELLSVLLNYVRIDDESSDLIKDPSFTKSSGGRHQCLQLLWSYSGHTVSIRYLIEAGCLEIMLNILKVMCK